MHDAISTLDRHQTRVMLGIVLGSVAAVGLSTGVLIGLAGGGQEPPPTPTPPRQAVIAPSDTPTPSSQAPTEPADSDVEPGRRSDVGVFVSAREEDDGIHVTFDRVQVVSGVEVINQNPKTRELVMSPQVAVFGGVHLAGSAQLQQISVQQLMGALPVVGSDTVLELTYDDLGYVVEVKEKQLP